MQHIEFIHRAHFEERYHRLFPEGPLAEYIDFFWQTRFDPLFKKYPRGFSDLLFPNTGYTYLINLGTPFTMRVDDERFHVKTDSFLPRAHQIECTHAAGNVLFGIKFRLSPVLLQKDVDFSEYRKVMTSLSYLIDAEVVADVKRAKSFSERVEVLSGYYLTLLKKTNHSNNRVRAVSRLLHQCSRNNHFNPGIEEMAEQLNISSRTLQRYFERVTGVGSKKTFQLMRVRKALSNLISEPETFDPHGFGYFDYSHFYRHLTSFMGKLHADVVLRSVRNKE